MICISPIPASRRTRCRATFRRVAGGALPKRGRGGAAAITGLSAQQPFPEERTAEAVFSVVVVDDVFAFKFGDGFFHGCRIEDLRRVEESAGVYLLAAALGDGAENARLLCGKLLDRKCEVVVLSDEDDCAKWYCAKRYYAIWHNMGSIAHLSCGDNMMK